MPKRGENSRQNSNSRSSEQGIQDLYDVVPVCEFVYGRKAARQRRHRIRQRFARFRGKKKHLNAEYFEHIHSLKWKMFRMTIIAQRGKKCERCGALGRLDLHHKHYRTFGNETPADVELLCFDCHDAADRQRKAQR